MCAGFWAKYAREKFQILTVNSTKHFQIIWRAAWRAAPYPVDKGCTDINFLWILFDLVAKINATAANVG
jgi:hypothetical protein